MFMIKRLEATFYFLKLLKAQATVIVNDVKIKIDYKEGTKKPKGLL